MLPEALQTSQEEVAAQAQQRHPHRFLCLHRSKKKEQMEDIP